MDWISLRQTFPKDPDFPLRVWKLQALQAVLSGTQYDRLNYPFSTEKAPNGDYIPLDQRRPSVRTNICRTVVDDAVSLLFSEGHWPNVVVNGSVNAVTAGLMALVKQTKLNEVMIDAATRGSVGSVAVLFQTFSNLPYFQVMDTVYLTPIWDPKQPDSLIRVVEKYKVTRADLVARGYLLPATSDPVNNEEKFWFQRIWTTTHEEWYQPWPVTSPNTRQPLIPKIDPIRTLHHALGFCPVVWGRNLAPFNQGDPDGGCTFSTAIDVVIEADYLLSQSGRGLKYSSDPTLVLKGVGPTEGDLQTGGAAGAIELPPEADAKLLEINGNAQAAVLAHVQELRAIALESLHGNRTHADKLSAATSGRAIEMMMTGLIWLADRLRISYGEGMLLGLLKVACQASEVLKGGLLIQGKKWVGSAEGLQLSWKPWVLPTYNDLVIFAEALATVVASGILSAETATARFGALIDIDDPTPELAKIKAEGAAKIAAAAQQAEAQAKLDQQTASVGQTLRHGVTA